MGKLDEMIEYLERIKKGGIHISPEELKMPVWSKDMERFTRELDDALFSLRNARRAKDKILGVDKIDNPLAKTEL